MLRKALMLGQLRWILIGASVLLAVIVGGERYLEIYQVNTATKLYETQMQMLESRLRKFIDAGAKGKVLMEAIRDFKRDRYQTAQTTFNPEVVAGMNTRKDGPLKDLLRDRYWSADLVQDPQTGELDFAGRDAIRAQVLREAKDADVPENYITDRGPRFKDPEVRRVIEEYEKDMETLKPYWEIPGELDKAFADYQHIGEKAQRLKAQNGAAWTAYLTETEQLLYKAREKSIELNRNILRNKSSLVDQALQKWYGYGEATPVPPPTPTPQPHIPLPPTKRGQAPSKDFLRDIFVVQASKEWKLPGRPYYNQLTPKQREVISERYEHAENIVKRKLGMSLTQVVDAMLSKGLSPKMLFDLLETEMGAFPKAPLVEPMPVVLPPYR